MLTIYRIIAFLEGFSFIVLIGIGVPLKYFFQNDAVVKSIGMPHGILFISYVFFSIIMKQKLSWSNKTFVIILIAAILPFGTFYTDFKYLRNN
ncbi:MAG: DUF3817 domain-containing protein [Bacteroidia bacterium]|jgi:integral membrane protein|nr:DUF3817 domain-containing protein [Bacteroidia bacterium]MDG2041394.1 DUF3817 domain-containing protein [Bacteroidia bacterium]|tara:strand:+ start:579 stop:857 length:279 start_codon:yes stop_codon:yes gene_type:complete